MNNSINQSLSGLSALERKPWICPRCQKVNAPHADQCKCTGSFQQGISPSFQQQVAAGQVSG